MSRRSRRSLDAVRLEAQKLALAPFAFQATRQIRDLGILSHLYDHGAADVDAIAEAVGVPRYGVLVLLEMGLSSGVVKVDDDDAWSITPIGIFIDRDPMTRANLDFTQDVCYRGLDHLGTAITEARPAGLAEISDKATVYEALATLPEKVRESWFGFDHFYSDVAFDLALKRVRDHGAKHVMDVGANTGRFAQTLLGSDPNVTMTLVDHPGQLAEADTNLTAAGVRDRATLHPMDVLDHDAPLPAGADVVWLSQFLDCFSEDEIVSILTRARKALNPGGRIAILELFWDRQPFEAGTYILHTTSLYFTAIANGTSRFYSAKAFIPLIEKAGLTVLEQEDDIGGLGHTQLWCAPA